MLSIESVRFDSSGWTLIEQTAEQIRWRSERPQILSLQHFPMPPNIPCSLTDLPTLRDFYRQGITQAGGGIVFIDVINLKSIRAIKSIFKVPNQPRDAGSIYIGSLTIPFAHASFVVKIQSAETPPIGQREKAVGEYLVLENLEQEDPVTKKMSNWSKDPYDPNFKGPFLFNRADEEIFDEHFPDHPLSQTRLTLRKIEESIDFDHDVLLAESFGGGISATTT